MIEDEPLEGEHIELGPDDLLQESAQDWATLAVGGVGLGVAGSKVAVDYARVRLDRDRLEFDRQKFEAEQNADSGTHPPVDDS